MIALQAVFRIFPTAEIHLELEVEQSQEAALYCTCCNNDGRKNETEIAAAAGIQRVSKLSRQVASKSR